jgi:hypothetical protein
MRSTSTAAALTWLPKPLNSRKRLVSSAPAPLEPGYHSESLIDQTGTGSFHCGARSRSASRIINPPRVLWSNSLQRNRHILLHHQFHPFIAEARETGASDIAVRGFDDDVGEISAPGIRDGTGLEFLKRGAAYSGSCRSLPHHETSQRRFAPMVIAIIPESLSASPECADWAFTDTSLQRRTPLPVHFVICGEAALRDHGVRLHNEFRIDPTRSRHARIVSHLVGS